MLSAQAAPDLAKADKLFDKHLYDEALKEYNGILKTANGDLKWRALYRAAESEALLFRYGEAAQRIFDQAPPEVPIWKARFLLLRAEISRQFLAQYGHGAPEDAQEGTRDVTKRTRKEWKAAIEKHLQELWDHKALLLSRRLSDEIYFVDIQQADITRVPTLWDFVVLRWTDYLLTHSPEDESKAPGDALLEPSFGTKVSFSLPRGLLAAALMEDAFRAPGEDRETARELWRIERVLVSQIPTAILPFSDTNEASRKAATTLESFMKAMRTPRARAKAGYESASLLNSLKQYAAAVALCRQVENQWPATTGAVQAQALRVAISLPRLSLNAVPRPPPGKDALKLYAKNLERVHFRLYPTDIAELFRGLSQDERNSWYPLRSLGNQTLSRFLKRSPQHTWITPISYKAPHAPTHVSPPQLPTLSAGLYVVVASSDEHFTAGKSLLAGTIVNITELMLFGSAGLLEPPGIPLPEKEKNHDGYHLYGINGLTGEPITGAEIEAHWRRRWDKGELKRAKTGADGKAVLPVAVSREAAQNTLDALLTSQGNRALWATPLYFSYYAPPRVQLHLETDRAVYRPGQKLSVKVTALDLATDGYRLHPAKSKLTLTANDAGGQEFYKATLTLNDMASASTQIEIPQGRILGGYSLNASLVDKKETFQAWASFSVEEYKRPEFELTLTEAEGAWKYGQNARVEGEARYYFGGKVPSAPVKYRVYRQLYIPWICWFWRWHPFSDAKTEIAAGDVKTNADGKFQFEFVAKAPPPTGSETFPSHYIVEVDARDAGGRTLSATRTYVAGEKAYLFDLQPGANVLKAATSEKVKLRVVNLNEKAVAEKGRFEIFSLSARPKPLPRDEDSEELPEVPSEVAATLPPQALYENVPDGERVAKGDFTTGGEDKSTYVPVGPLPEGIYRLKVSAKDPFGGEAEQALILVVADLSKEKVDLPIPAVSLSEQSSYVVGETATFLVGSDELKGKLFVEHWRGPFLTRTEVLDGGVRRLRVPIGHEDRGGISIRWFGSHDFRARSGEARVTVPWTDKELSVEVKAEKTLKPGEKASWELQVRDSGGAAVDGEATIRIYDRSLDYYAKPAPPWVENLYAPAGGPAPIQGSLFLQRGTGAYVDEQWLAKHFKIIGKQLKGIQEREPPSLRSARSRGYGRGRYMLRHELGGGRMADAPTAAMADAAAPAEMSKRASSAPELGANALGAKQAAASAPPPGLRKNFSETAYFGPHVALKGGKAKLEFEMPDQLTGWRLSSTIITRDVQRGTASHEFVTRKDLMIRVEIPRFLREKDRGTLKAIIHNETEEKLSGTLTLEILEDGKVVGSRLGLSERPESFSVKSHSLQEFSFPVNVGEGIASYRVRAIARAGELVDAEERDLPILPSQERLLASRMVALDGNTTKRLTPPRLETGDRIEHSIVQIDPQLALTILNSLPFLVQYPYECTEQVLNRYLPLAIVNQVFAKYPAVAEAVRKIPPRDTVTPEWDRTDPRRAMSLLETPWEGISKGVKAQFPTINLLKPETVEKERKSALDTLASYQRPNGAFPWFPGGQDDPYMTLYVLAGLAEAREFGVAVPEAIVRRAFDFVLAEIPRRLKPDQGHVAMALYAAYVMSRYLDGYAWAKPAAPAIRTWLAFADKNSRAMTPFGKGYAALAYATLGEREKSDHYLARALDGSRRDEITGVYWTPEKISWLWYTDTVEKHAFFLRTLLKLKPSDDRIPGIAQWLIFNRKGSEWKSTKSSAAAIYSLLDFMKRRGALDRGDKFSLQWAEVKESFTVEPTDWLAKPLRWAKGGEDAARTNSTPVTIEKKGPGFAFASLTTLFATSQPRSEGAGQLVTVDRKFFRRVKDTTGFRLVPLGADGAVEVGDQIEVQLTLKSRAQFEYVHIKAPKGAGFEAEDLVSGWNWDQLSRYQEPRDSLMNFFVSWLPHGEYVLKYRLRATTTGKYQFGSAVVQSMYAPEVTAYSSGATVRVK